MNGGAGAGWGADRVLRAILSICKSGVFGKPEPGAGGGAGFPARAGGVPVPAGGPWGSGTPESVPRRGRTQVWAPAPWDPGLAVTPLGPRPACPQDGSRSGRGGHRTRVPPAGAGGGREGPGGVPGAGALPGRETCGCLGRGEEGDARGGGEGLGDPGVERTRWVGEGRLGEGLGVQEEDGAGGEEGRRARDPV